MSGVALLINNRPVTVDFQDIPVFRADGIEILEQYGCAEGKELQGKVKDLSRLIDSQSLVHKNETKAKVVSVLLTAAAVSIFAAGAFFAIASFASMSYFTLGSIVAVGYLGARIAMEINSLVVAKMLGMSALSIDNWAGPIKAAFTSRSFLDKEIPFQTQKISNLFETVIKEYKEKFDSSMKELITAEKITRDRLNLIRDFPLLSSQKYQEVVDEDEKLDDNLRKLGLAIADVKRMNGYLRGLEL